VGSNPTLSARTSMKKFFSLWFGFLVLLYLANAFLDWSLAISSLWFRDGIVISLAMAVWVFATV
jgi:hypothetical protein